GLRGGQGTFRGAGGRLVALLLLLQFGGRPRGRLGRLTPPARRRLEIVLVGPPAPAAAAPAVAAAPVAVALATVAALTAALLEVPVVGRLDVGDVQEAVAAHA